MSHEMNYFRERAENERAMAKAATHQSVITVHQDMADRYEALVRHAKTDRILRPV